MAGALPSKRSVQGLLLPLVKHGVVTSRVKAQPLKAFSTLPVDGRLARATCVSARQSPLRLDARAHWKKHLWTWITSTLRVGGRRPWRSGRIARGGR